MKKILVLALAFMVLAITVAFAQPVKKYYDVNQPYSFSPNPSFQRTITASTYTVVAQDHMINCDTTSNAIVITLPRIYLDNVQSGKAYIFKRAVGVANAISVVASTADTVTNTINGAAARYIPKQLGAYLVIRYSPQGADWKVSFETDPVQKDMSTGIVTIGTTTYEM